VHTESQAAKRRTNLGLLARAAKGGLVGVADAQKVWGLSANAAVARLARYKRSGWLRHARRGLYLVVPLEADPRDPLTVQDPWILANEVFAPCYLAGWTAAHHWGLTERIFGSVFVASAASLRSTTCSVLGLEFRLAHFAAKRVRHAESISRGPHTMLVSGPELTLAEALVNPAWMGGIRHLAEVLRSYHDSSAWKPPLLIEKVRQSWSGAAFKRLGWLTERLFPRENELIEACLRGRTSGLVSLDPAVTTPGRIQKRWGLRVNVDVEPADSHGRFTLRTESVPALPTFERDDP
jgi:predicted transcriptional regulator of viral defense system